MESTDITAENNNIVATYDRLVPVADIEKMILTIRGVQVMIDRDLAMLYGVTTSRLNEQVKRNIKRFPDISCFNSQRRNLKFGNRNLRHPIPLLWVHASDLMLLQQTALLCLAAYFVQKLL